jgi:hypothetical protein
MHLFCEWRPKLKPAFHKVVPEANAYTLLYSQVGQDIKSDEW